MTALFISFFFFSLSFIIFAPHFALSFLLIVATQIPGSHSRLSFPPPSPLRFGPCIFIARRFRLFLSLVDSRRVGYGSIKVCKVRKVRPIRAMTCIPTSPVASTYQNIQSLPSWAEWANRAGHRCLSHLDAFDRRSAASDKQADKVRRTLDHVTRHLPRIKQSINDQTSPVNVTPATAGKQANQ